MLSFYLSHTHTTAFGATTFGAAPKPLGGFPSTPSVGVGMFGATPTSQFGASPLPGQQQPQVQITHLATRDRRPVTYGTKVEDLDDASRALLQELEKKVKQHREHKRQLETFERVQATGAWGKKLRDELDMEVHVLSKKVQVSRRRGESLRHRGAMLTRSRPLSISLFGIPGSAQHAEGR